jgi:hypothetical protein
MVRPDFAVALGPQAGQDGAQTQAPGRPDASTRRLCWNFPLLAEGNTVLGMLTLL